MVVNEVATSISTVVADILTFLPNVIGAVIILIIGWILGRIFGGFVSKIMERVGVDKALENSFAGPHFHRFGARTSDVFGTLVKWFIYIIFIMAAVNVLNIAIFTELLRQFLLYIPELIAAILILLVGLVVIDYLMDWIRDWLESTKVAFADTITTVLQAFLSLVIVMLALDEARINTTIIYTFLVPIAWGLGIGLALAIGIGVGWGSKDTVSDYLTEKRQQIKTKGEEATKETKQG